MIKIDEGGKTEQVKFKGTPLLFVELVKHLQEQLGKVIDDPTLFLDIDPADIKNNPQVNIVTITFQTKRQTEQVSQKGAGSWLNYYAKEARGAIDYYDYGYITAKPSPDQETWLNVTGYGIGHDTSWSTLWGWLRKQLASEGYIDSQSNEVRDKVIINNLNEQHSSRPSRAKLLAVALFVIGIVLALVTNVASAKLPKEIEPYLWLSWPSLGVLTIVSILLLLKQQNQ